MNASKECLPADNLTTPSPSTPPLLPPPSQITHINLSRDNINNVSLDEWIRCATHANISNAGNKHVVAVGSGGVPRREQTDSFLG